MLQLIILTPYSENMNKKTIKTGNQNFNYEFKN